MWPMTAVLTNTKWPDPLMTLESWLLSYWEYHYFFKKIFYKKGIQNPTTLNRYGTRCYQREKIRKAISGSTCAYTEQLQAIYPTHKTISLGHSQFPTRYLHKDAQECWPIGRVLCLHWDCWGTLCLSNGSRRSPIGAAFYHDHHL